MELEGLLALEPDAPVDVPEAPPAVVEPARPARLHLFCEAPAIAQFNAVAGQGGRVVSGNRAVQYTWAHYLAPHGPAQRASEFNGGDVRIIAFDARQRASYERATQVAYFYGSTMSRVLLVAYNCDPATRVVSTEEACEWAWTRGRQYMEVNLADRRDVARVVERACEEAVSANKKEIAWQDRMLNMFKSERDQNERQRARMNSTFSRFYQKIFSVLFDLFQITIACIDVTTDLLVAIQYYQAGHMTFFYIALIDIMIAQVCYTGFFLAVYCPSGRPWRERILLFLVFLPFGQLIPLFMYIDSLKIERIQKMLTRCGLRSQLEEDVQPRTDAEDPLRTYLMKKFFAHVGFYIESLVEAIPQSILQLVAIVVTGQVTAVSVFSIAVSVISVAAKGMMISYSIHRPTFVFNFLCVIFDVFSLFATASWLFYKPQHEAAGLASVFFIKHPVDIYSAVWFYKEFVFVIIMALFGVLIMLMFVTHEAAAHPVALGARRNVEFYAKQVLAIVAGVLLFVPINIAVDAVKFCWLPLLVFRSVDSPHGVHGLFYKFVFDFLRGSDFRERSYAVNGVLAEERRARFPNPPPDVPVTQIDHIRKIFYGLATYLNTVNHRDYQLSDLRRAAGYNIEGVRFVYGNMTGAFETGDHVWDVRMFRVGRVYLSFVLSPAWVISNAISLVYPFLRLASLGANETAPAQRFFTWSLVLFGTIMILLTPSVYKFRRAVFYTMTFLGTFMRHTMVDVIEERYALLGNWMRVEKERKEGLPFLLPPGRYPPDDNVGIFTYEPPPPPAPPAPRPPPPRPANVGPPPQAAPSVAMPDVSEEGAGVILL